MRTKKRESRIPESPMVQPVTVIRKVSFMMINTGPQFSDDEINAIAQKMAEDLRRQIEVREFCRIYCAVNPASFNFGQPRRRRG